MISRQIVDIIVKFVDYKLSERNMLKFSLVGLGHIGRVHKEAIEETEGAELVAIIDLNFSQDESRIPVYETLESFLENDKETDVVIIATPNGLHFEHAIMCLKAGKHVLIEKPIALNLKDAQRILDVAKTHNRRVFSSMQLRFSPPVRFVKNLIENQSLGEIYMVNIHCYWNRNKNYYQVRDWSGSLEMDGGVLFTQFSHFIDILNYWFDETRCTQSWFSNFSHQGVTEFPDTGKLDFKADGVEGNMIFTTSVYEKNYTSRIVIIAEKGTLEIGDQYLNQLNYCNMENEVATEDFSTEVKNFHPQAISEIVEALTENRNSTLDGEHALRLVKFIEEALDFKK